MKNIKNMLEKYTKQLHRQMTDAKNIQRKYGTMWQQFVFLTPKSELNLKFRLNLLAYQYALKQDQKIEF